MQILEINKKNWMIGIEWEILPGDSTIKSEAREVAEKTNSRFGVIVDYDSIYAIGLTKKLAKEPSAALYLAVANQAFRENNQTDYPDWVVLEEVSEEKYWMGVIKSGLPAPQFDSILSITEVKERIQELLINDTYSIYSSSQELISIFDGIKTIENRSLSDLTLDVKTKIKFEKLLGIPNKVIYAGIGAVIAVGMAYGALQLVEGLTLREKARNLAEKQEREKQQQLMKYNQDLKLYEDSKIQLEKAKKEEIVSGLSGNPTQILNGFYENIGNSDMGTHGWTMKTVECYYNPITSTVVNPALAAATNTATVIDNNSPKLACDYLYERTKLGTTRMFLEDFPDAKLNGDKAVVTKNVEIDPIYIKKAESSILETLKPAKDWGFDVQSQLQLLKVVEIEHEIKSSSEIMYEVPGKPLSPDEITSGIKQRPPESNQVGIGAGEIIISGKNFDLVKEIADNVDFSGTGIKKVVFNVKDLGQIEWTAHLNYYIKTKDGGIGSASSISQDKAVEQKK